MTDHYLTVGGVRLHYIEFPSSGPTIILMHGLTANAHAFDGLIAAGLTRHARVISIDLRGRGESDQAKDYSMVAHAEDIIRLLDHLTMPKAIVGGHSFGALLSYYLAAHYPERIDKMILMDAAARLHPDTKDMLIPAMSRLGKTFPSFEEYLETVKKAPYIDKWDDKMVSYYRADVRFNDDGTVSPIPTPMDMGMAVTLGLKEPWLEYIQGVDKKAILINGPGNYTLDAALLPEEYALETVNMMQDCKYVKVDGNHQTMLYGSGAAGIVSAIADFLDEDKEDGDQFNIL